MTELEALKVELHQRVEELKMNQVEKGIDPVLFYETFSVGFKVTEQDLRKIKEGQNEKSN